MQNMKISGSQESRAGFRTQAKVFKLEQQMPGYTGFVPKIQNIMASTYANSSRLAMSCPPTPDIETVEYNWNVGKRRLRTAAPLAGTGFRGFLNESDGVPFEMSTTMTQVDYTQGSRVNLASYYEDQRRKMERQKRENPRSVTQKRNPVRNISQVPFGDSFYYSGKHMFETTTKESQDFAQHTTTKSLETSFSSTMMRKRSGELSYNYKIAHAMVGKLRLNLLHKLVGEMVQAKVITGNKDMIRMFNFFASINKDAAGGGAHVTIGYKQFLGIVQKLGVYMTEREACALFGRYDSECRGALTYFQFIDLFFDEGERVKVDEN